MAQAHDNNPTLFPSPHTKDYDVICDHVGVFPYIAEEEGGCRIESEVVGGQKVVHAYGPQAGGYTYSFGIGIEVVKLINELLGPALLRARM